MFYLFLFYFMMVPLEYLQEKFPKGANGLNYQNIMMLLMVGYWVYYRNRKGKPLTVPNPLNGLLIAYLVLNGLGSVLTTLTVSGAPSFFEPFGLPFTRYLRLINAVLFFWLGLNLVDSRKKMQYVLYALVLSMMIGYRSVRSDLNMHSFNSFNNNLRFRGPLVNLQSNELAAILMYQAIFMSVFAFAQKRIWEKLGFLTVAGAYMYGLLYTYSRGAQLAFIAVMGMITSLRYRWALILLIMAVATQSMWVPESVRERWEMTTTDDGQLESSAESRTEFWATALNLYFTSPLVGHGVGSFIILNPAKMDTHNLYLRIMAEQGTVGILEFLAMLGMILYLCSQLWRRANSHYDQQFGFALMMTTIGLMICTFFGDRFTYLPILGQFMALTGIATRLYCNMLGIEPIENQAETRSAHSQAEAPLRKLELNVIQNQAESGLPESKDNGQPHGGRTKAELNIVQSNSAR